MSDVIIKAEGLKKQYRLGVIGGATLTAELQSRWARLMKKEDPNSKIGSRQYGKNEKFWALNGLDFEVKAGEVVGIIGRNGAGKSTLLKLLSRVTAPTEGTIYLGGRVASMLEVGTGFNQEMTGRENIYLNGAILGMSRAEVDRKIDEIIDFSECRQFIDTPVKRYSSGMYVKLAFSVASHLDAEIMIMDEVLAVGDMAFQRKCLNKMRGVADSSGRTILYVGHNMNTIRQLCDRCLVMEKGRIIFDGDVETAIEMYLNEYSEMKTLYDVRSQKRPDWFPQKIATEEIEFLDRSDMYFESTEPMRCAVRWRAFDDMEDIYIRMTLKYRDSSSVGMNTTLVPLSAKKGELNETILTFDNSNLATGMYYGDIHFYRNTGVGGSENLDSICPAFSFDLLNNSRETGGLTWANTGWGCVVLPEIKVGENA